jgi:KaiC/GvpD/RAD55 family RecA-like ATPase
VSEERPPASPMDLRVSTGNAGLDSMLEGGLVGHRPYLIVGPAGTGKTSLALQFLCEGVRRGERVLLVTLEEPPNEARLNHRGFLPELDQVEVFDAIPDIMRYERVPFKDIASVRAAVPFGRVLPKIRVTPELSSVEVTITALEQMLRSEVARRAYTRVVIDSLTALQYFCMKGFDPVAGAQTFLRFLTDLRTTTILTVESPLEDADTPERMLARGEIRLFRWELEGQTVRAIGVEKFRGSAHDVRLHPYRIGPRGIDINLPVTISRDTRQIIEPVLPAAPIETFLEGPTAIEPLEEAIHDLVLVGAPLDPLRDEIAGALEASQHGDRPRAAAQVAHLFALTEDLEKAVRRGAGESVPIGPGAGEAYQRIVVRAESVRAGLPPSRLPAPPLLQQSLARILETIPPRVAPAPPEAPEPSPPAPPADEEVVSEPEAAPAPTMEETTALPPPPPPESELPPAPVELEVADAEPESVPATAPVPATAVHAEGASGPPPAPPPEELPPEPLPEPVAEPSNPEPAPEPEIEPEPETAPKAPPPAEAPPPPAVPPPPPPIPVEKLLPGLERIRPKGYAPPKLHVREAPPPLPRVGAPAPPVATRTSPAAATPALPRPPPPPSAAPPSGPSAPPSDAAARRRKKSAAPARRKGRAREEPSPAPTAGAPSLPRTDAAPSLFEPAPAPEAPTPKGKRRAPRKRKAPHVVGARAGEIPAEQLGSPPAQDAGESKPEGPP